NEQASSAQEFISTAEFGTLTLNVKVEKHRGAYRSNAIQK
ncbi:MAG: hypothetical protein US65_C0024G0012, partial [Candidatus Yanofskybacteria bacterium GW2011_GWC2_37_9]